VQTRRGAHAVGYSQNDYQAYYHDDPIEEISKTKSRFKFLTTGAIVLGSIFYFQSTLAGNISLSSGTGIEFGQGFSQAVACSGNTDLTLTPRSTFINGSDSSGAHYLSSVTVSNIPDSCFGVDFTINAYGNTENSPLSLFNSTSTNAIVYNNAGTFSTGVGSSGMTLTGSTGTFTATFTTPAAQSSSVFKLTIQSGVHTPVYDVGDRGPGGGIVYYVSANNFTSTGSTCNTKCRYLEVAPSTWRSGTAANDLTYQWSTDTTTATAQDKTTVSTEGIPGNSGYEKLNWKIGQGFYNTSVMKVAGATSSIQAAVLAYAGGAAAGQWFIPSMNELNELCKYARGQSTGNLTIECNPGSGTLKSGTANDLGGFVEGTYWSSSEFNAFDAWAVWVGGPSPTGVGKDYPYYVRPVRAF